MGMTVTVPSLGRLARGRHPPPHSCSEPSAFAHVTPTATSRYPRGPPPRIPPNPRAPAVARNATATRRATVRYTAAGALIAAPLRR